MLIQNTENSLILDPTGETNRYFAIAGTNDTEAQPATTILTSPGFIGKEHKRECLNFWYTIKVKLFSTYIMVFYKRHGTF